MTGTEGPRGPAQRQDEAVLGGAQDGVRGGPLPVHGRVVPADGGVRHVHQEPGARHHPARTHRQVTVDLRRGVGHGVLPHHVRRLPRQETASNIKQHDVNIW